jgi:hypothetical protein
MGIIVVIWTLPLCGENINQNEALKPPCAQIAPGAVGRYRKTRKSTNGTNTSSIGRRLLETGNGTIPVRIST